MIQQENAKQYEDEKEEIKDMIKENEGPDITALMAEDRRRWVQDYKGKHGNKPPDDLTDFYKKFDVQVALSPEDEEARKAEEEEKSKSKKKDKKKEEKKKDKKGKKGKKGGDGDGDAQDNLAMVGPSEVVQKFDEFHMKYNDDWANKDEAENPNQKFDQ